MLEGSTRAGSLARVPLGEGAPKRILNDVQFADWSQDGSELAITHFIPEKHAYRLEYPIGKVLYETSGWIGQLRLSPDGRTIAFIDHPIFGDDQGYVAVIPSSGGTVRLSCLWGNVGYLVSAKVGHSHRRRIQLSVYPTRSVPSDLTVPGGLLLETRFLDSCWRPRQ